jgi:hypothetical protein
MQIHLYVSQEVLVFGPFCITFCDTRVHDTGLPHSQCTGSCKARMGATTICLQADGSVNAFLELCLTHQLQ